MADNIPFTEQDKNWFDPNFRKVSDFLGIDSRGDFNYYHDKIKNLIDYSKVKTGKDDVSAVLGTIKDIESYLGNSKRTNERMANLYRYTRLDSTINELKKQREAYSQEPTKEKKAAKPRKKTTPKKSKSNLNIQKEVSKSMKGVNKQIQTAVRSTVKENIKQSIEGAVKDALGGLK